MSGDSKRFVALGVRLVDRIDGMLRNPAWPRVWKPDEAAWSIFLTGAEVDLHERHSHHSESAGCFPNGRSALPISLVDRNAILNQARVSSASIVKAFAPTMTTSLV
jgi:hypothetical protein